MLNRVLLVEDNLSIANSVKASLEENNFQVITAINGQLAVEEFNKYQFDIVLLDLYLPKVSGEEVLQYIRRKSDVPVIIISMKSSDVEKTINLGLGADDFLTKPFSMLELLARTKAVIRRTKNFAAAVYKEIYKFGQYTINLNDYSVKNENESISLTTKEFEILKLLILNPQKVFSKSDIYRLIWHESELQNDNIINVHMKNLREKIEPNNELYTYILTVWGFGYKLGKQVIVSS